MKKIIPITPSCKKMSTSNKNELVDWILTDRNMFLFFLFFYYPLAPTCYYCHHQFYFLLYF